MPAYPDGVRKKAEREEWQSRKREKGKGAEYHIGSLPIETRRYLAEQAVAAQGHAVTDHAAGGKAMAKLLAREVPVKPEAGRRYLPGPLSRLPARGGGSPRLYRGIPCPHSRPACQRL
nr:DNA-binding protein [Aeromonas jandaei]